MNNSGVPSLSPVSFSFTILPPLWKRNWFVLLSVLFIMATSILIIRNYLNRFRREETYRRSLAELEITAIRAQMNPHFIFNAINSIYNFVLTGDRKTSASYVARFARLIRNMLEFSAQKKITLEQELNTLRLYLDIEQLRFRETFEYEILIDESIQPSSLQIVPMLFQPYVENAIWHGLSPKDGIGRLTIAIRREDEKITCVIDDNGIGRAAASKKDQPGISKHAMSSKMNQRRLDLLRELYGFGFEIQYKDKFGSDGKSSGTQVIIHIPAKTTFEK
jgi:LytS/YehU family sensor histidine kinase